jgi:superfamily I DNA/RNA helicase
MSHTPTDEQQKIIEAILAGESIMVNALAGAAKSSTIEMGAKALAEAGMQSIDGLALAFNKKIAEELTPRLPFPVKTLNALGFAAWGKKVGKMQLQADKMTTIKNAIKDGLPWDLVRLVGLAKLSGLVPAAFRTAAKAEILFDERSSWEALAEAIDFNLEWENPQTGKIEDMLEHARMMLTRSVKDAFLGIIDFDDQVYMPTIYGGQFPSPRVLFVDEAQDLSPLNHLMLKQLKPKQLVVVGDPLQSIYAFRGADVFSMDKLKKDWDLKEYRLTMCFRCSTSVAAAAKQWAPEMKSPEWAKEGAVVDVLWNNTLGGPPRESWSFADLPAQITILCRNNAPLIKLALKIFRTKRIAFLGNKGAAQMLSQLRQIMHYKGKGKSVEEVAAAIDAWRTKEILVNDPRKHEQIMDKAEALLHCAEAASDYIGIERVIEDLFDAKSANIYFGTGHGAKGLEWPNVLHLDPWRLPSKFATTDSAIQQEENLAYVITTRAKENLYFANMDDFKKEGV